MLGGWSKLTRYPRVRCYANEIFAKGQMRGKENDERVSATGQKAELAGRSSLVAS